MADIPTLAIATDKVCFVVVKARQYDVKDAVTEPDAASNASDDGMISVLEDHEDDPVRRELIAFIAALNEEEQVDLVALAWLGRGDGEVESFDELRGEAQRARNGRTGAYLLGIPLLADYLEEGLSQFGESCNAFEEGRL
ncbi:DUF3775 domain-containing protein [Bosea sp. Leaf344]|uniref:DUF3775 domain-containing protein n=1 Tax=Bosea sp. Leaf344 TaxID=1736346 RepID=UPI000ADC378B|nr:DUF3775 domain-containing protein [Bosea sp. Leaf344]